MNDGTQRPPRTVYDDMAALNEAGRRLGGDVLSVAGFRMTDRSKPIEEDDRG